MNLLKTTYTPYKIAKLILFIFISFAGISYLYVIFTGTYNGDFLGITPKLGQWKLFLNFVYTVIPFVVLFLLFKHYYYRKSRYKITIPVKLLGEFLFVVLIFQIIVTLVYGVGKMGQDVYQAPAGIKPFIQVFNRFNPIFGMFIYGVLSNKSKKAGCVLWLLVIILSLLRGSLGVFIYLFFFLIIQYNQQILLFVKKRILLTILLLAFLPALVTTLYAIREKTRHQQDTVTVEAAKQPFSKVIFGKLVGRLSSYSNSAIIMEQKDKIAQLSHAHFSNFQYAKEATIPITGGHLVNTGTTTYTSILLESLGVHAKNISFMTGTQGSLLIGYYTSKPAFIINIITILLILIITFELITLLQVPQISTIVFLFFCFNVMSGVALEYANTLICTVLYLFLFMLPSFFRRGA